jgi:kumamolisin
VSLVLRPRRLHARHPLVRRARASEAALPAQRRGLTRHEALRLLSPPRRAVRAAAAFARAHGLRIVATLPERCEVALEATVERLEAAFGVALHEVEHAGRRHRAHAGPVRLPAALLPHVSAVLGLETLPVVGKPFGTARPRRRRGMTAAAIARAYGTPPGPTGRGQRIAILAFGGGFHRSDVRRHLRAVLGGPAPTIRVVGVLGARNAPLAVATLGRVVSALDDPRTRLDALAARFGAAWGPALATIETTMDVSVVAGVAPGAEIVVVFAPPTAQGFHAAVHEALDGAAGTADVISISWGRAEPSWPLTGMHALHLALERARHLGVTVCCASGDLGSRCVPPPGAGSDLASTSHPASNPDALAVGGTQATIGRGRLEREVSWEATWHGERLASGGGASGFFRRPSWQARSGVPTAARLGAASWLAPGLARAAFVGRGVPDVAAHAAEASGYRIVAGGRELVTGGTSAAAPLWAAMLAVLGEALGRRVGWVNALLYRSDFATGFRDVTRGDNDVCGGCVPAFAARRGWDACTGLGSPDVARLLALLRGGA